MTRFRLVTGVGILSACSVYLVIRDHLALLVAMPALVGWLGWRWRDRRSVGLRWRAALIVLGAIALISTAWLLVMGVVMGLAGAVRPLLPIPLEQVMRAIPGNGPEPWAAMLGGDRWIGPWTALYLAGFTAVPLCALAWAVVRGARSAALLIIGSHASTFVICLPIFILLPVPDPWFGTGWWFGEPCPWWWRGMHEQLVTFCFPSMHMAVGTAVVLAIRRFVRHPWLRSVWWLWLIVLAASTVALRTHWLVDLPAGVAVGFLAHAYGQRVIRWQWRRSRRIAR